MINIVDKRGENNWHLVVCGPGSDKFVNVQNERIHFVGSVGTNDRCYYYAIADLFVLPNTYKPKIEPWGLTVNEAMSFGLPILVSDATGSGRDLVYPGINGYILNADSLEAELDYYLHKMLRNKQELQRFGENSHRIISLYTFDNMAQAFITATDH